MKLYLGVFTKQGALSLDAPELEGKSAVFIIVDSTALGLLAVNICRRGQLIATALPLGKSFRQYWPIGPDNGGVMSNVIAWFRPMQSDGTTLDESNPEPPPPPRAAEPPKPAPPTKNGIPEPRESRLVNVGNFQVNALTVSDKEGILVAGGMDDEIRISNLATGDLRSETFLSQSKTWAVAFAPDGLRYASAHSGGRVTVRNVCLRTPIASKVCGNKFSCQVSWSPDGWDLSFASGKRFWIWDTSDASNEPKPHASGFDDTRSVTWSPTGALLAVAGDGGIRHFLPDGSPHGGIYHLGPGFGEISTALWNPKSDVIAVAAKSGKLCLWNVVSNKVSPLDGHAEQVRALAWSPDGRTLVSGGNDRAVRFWDGSGEPGASPAPKLSLEGFQEAVRAVTVFDGGRKLVVSTNRHHDADPHHLAVCDFGAPNFGRTD